MQIYELNNIPEDALDSAGGKAKGLNRLMKAGLNAPEGFVIIGLESAEDYSAAVKYYNESGYNAVAVRSSATAEDGEDFSAAGQYVTVLDVIGSEKFLDALKQCMNSLKSDTATAYSAFFSDAKSCAMSIVVQKMVDAVSAGVAFTANPVTGELAVLIEAVRGVGEALVSGHAQSESYRVPLLESGAIDIGDLPINGSILSMDETLRIAADAVGAKEYFGGELDLEWAINRSGNLMWLQARPITTLDSSGIDELDCREFTDDIVFTTCNIGEMLPGAVTPLSLSTSVASIDKGLRKMLVTAGAYKNLKELPPKSCVVSFSNHLFFKLTTIYKMAVTIIGAAKPDVEASICGKKLDTPDLPWKKASGIRRLFNAVKYFKFLLSRNKAKKKINKVIEKIAIGYSVDPSVYYNNIDKALVLLDEATWLHYITSAHSGAMSSALLTILSQGKTEHEAREILAGLLEDIDDIESVDILRSMRSLARECVKAKPVCKDMHWSQLATFIKNDTGDVRAAYDSFMSRHGHRAIREAELRSKSWEMDEQGFMENLLTVINSGADEPEKKQSNVDEHIAKALDGKKGILKKVIKYIIGQSRQGVYNREYTKARFVRAVDRFKKAYVRLAKDLVAVHALPDEDLIYFLTHEELGEMIRSRSSKYLKTALKRRRLLSEQSQVKFKDVYIGKPEPIIYEEVESTSGTVLKGVPISRGEVKGIARVVRTVEDAKRLTGGEIMVAAFTDIGWSPYYSVIGGLVTEVGSALSHGAVVAREYALPLVVNVAGATNIIKTGDYISLNGSKGTVTIIEKANDSMSVSA